MSDGEMERVDEALSAVFRSRISEKSSKKGLCAVIIVYRSNFYDFFQMKKNP